MTAQAYVDGCELLLKFVSLWFETTVDAMCSSYELLWITFKICTFVISNNYSMDSYKK